MNRFYTLICILILCQFSAIAQKDYKDYVKDALDYTENRDFAAAEQAYKAAMRKEPANASNIMLLMNLGTIQRSLGKLDEALISYNVVAQKYPNLSHILESRATLYCEMDRYEDAMKDYNTILLHDAEDIKTLYSRGLLHITMKNMDEAEGDFKTITAIDHDNPLGMVGMAMIMKRKGEWKEAEEAYTELIRSYRRNGELYANRAECYLYLKKLRSMSDDLTKAVELGYDDMSVPILRGQLKLAQYDKKAAKEEFMKAKEMGASDELVSEFLLLCK